MLTYRVAQKLLGTRGRYDINSVPSDFCTTLYNVYRFQPGVDQRYHLYAALQRRTQKPTFLHQRLAVARVNSQRSGFDSSPIYVKFVTDKVAMGQVFIRLLRFLLSVSFSECPAVVYSSITDGAPSQKLRVPLNNKL